MIRALLVGTLYAEPQQRTSANGERELAGLLRELLGADVTRNLLQARQGGADLLGIDGWAIEVKRAARVPPWRHCWGLRPATWPRC